MPDHSHTSQLMSLSRTGPEAGQQTSPLNTLTLSEAGVCAGAPAQAGEARKHSANDDKYVDLGWVYVPLAIETYPWPLSPSWRRGLPSGFKSPNQFSCINCMVA